MKVTLKCVMREGRLVSKEPENFEELQRVKLESPEREQVLTWANDVMSLTDEVMTNMDGLDNQDGVDLNSEKGIVAVTDAPVTERAELAGPVNAVFSKASSLLIGGGETNKLEVVQAKENGAQLGFSTKLNELIPNSDRKDNWYAVDQWNMVDSVDGQKRGIEIERWGRASDEFRVEAIFLPEPKVKKRSWWPF